MGANSRHAAVANYRCGEIRRTKLELWSAGGRRLRLEENCKSACVLQPVVTNCLCNKIQLARVKVYYFMVSWRGACLLSTLLLLADVRIAVCARLCPAGLQRPPSVSHLFSANSASAAHVGLSPLPPPLSTGQAAMGEPVGAACCARGALTALNSHPSLPRPCTAAFNFGGATGAPFGAPAFGMAPSPAPAFGAAPAAGAFGAPAAVAAPAFGAGPATPSPFGAPAAAPAPAFGATAPAFGAGGFVASAAGGFSAPAPATASGAPAPAPAAFSFAAPAGVSPPCLVVFCFAVQFLY